MRFVQDDGKAGSPDGDQSGDQDSGNDPNTSKNYDKLRDSHYGSCGKDIKKVRDELDSDKDNLPSLSSGKGQELDKENLKRLREEFSEPLPQGLQGKAKQYGMHGGELGKVRGEIGYESEEEDPFATPSQTTPKSELGKLDPGKKDEPDKDEEIRKLEEHLKKMVGRKITSNYNIINKKFFNSQNINKYHNPNYFDNYKEKSNYFNKIIEYNKNLEDKFEQMYEKNDIIMNNMYKKTDQILKDTDPKTNYPKTLEEILAEYLKKVKDEDKKDEK